MRVEYAKLDDKVVGRDLTAVSHTGESPGQAEYAFGASLGVVTGVRFTQDPEACVVRIGEDGVASEFGIAPGGWIEVA